MDRIMQSKHYLDCAVWPHNDGHLLESECTCKNPGTMTVRELIQELAEWPPDTEVRIGHPTETYDIGSISYEDENLLLLNVVESET